jgi:hypothetical protein
LTLKVAVYLSAALGDGMVVFVLKILTAVHLKHLDHEKIEAIWLRVVTKSSSMTIGSLYRPPDNTALKIQ